MTTDKCQPIKTFSNSRCLTLIVSQGDPVFFASSFKVIKDTKFSKGTKKELNSCSTWLKIEIYFVGKEAFPKKRQSYNNELWDLKLNQRVTNSAGHAIFFLAHWDAHQCAWDALKPHRCLWRYMRIYAHIYAYICLLMPYMRLYPHMWMMRIEKIHNRNAHIRVYAHDVDISAMSTTS